ncbi:hypothetical protein MUK71_11065 [Arthrobacter zhangbolii]|uniref:ATP/GTP-binding protein n=1 Tax=Arthrobacter zhangbolii TaxID=2886936 RepID=A0A9X1SCF5_9MICC|nr:hypothetical protein [Arthrobacter zhangbolii]MCC3273854.1 hypothetical protein [Arthrobacter zhangbolii]MCC3294707.1 hypothetical protein [Arthrobacter zhangbolii]UON91149.1 hypothetical protein MUK71_11065 [Arthrobacter zhangbolii]
MPRSNRPRRVPSPGSPAGRNARRKWASAPPEVDLERTRAGLPRHESGPDGEWSVRQITAQNAAKDYRCPGCGVLIPPGTAHLVVWQEDSLLGRQAAVEGRRHWHSHCWRTRRRY